MTLRHTVAGAVAAGTAVRLVTRLGAARLPGSSAVWERTNHAGGEVSLAEGPGIVLGTSLAGLTLPAAGVAALSAGALGALDDVVGTTSSKGLRGHLLALRHGQVTTGAVKVLGLATSGLLAALMLDRSVTGRTLIGGGVIAGAANVINLFDLRPGRALKVGLAIGLPLLPAGGFAEGALIGACLAAVPEDFAATSMMGDTGANALGALTGTLIVARSGWRGRTTALAVIIVLTLTSERVSFSQVIAHHPVLRRLDEWGRSSH